MVRNSPLEPARPCCFAAAESFVFGLLTRTSSFCMVSGRESFDATEPKRNKNLGFVSRNSAKSASLCQIVTKNTMVFSGFKRNVLTPAVGEMWCQNSPLEPARPCCFAAAGSFFYRSSDPHKQLLYCIIWARLVKKNVILIDVNEPKRTQT